MNGKDVTMENYGFIFNYLAFKKNRFYTEKERKDIINKWACEETKSIEQGKPTYAMIDLCKEFCNIADFQLYMDLPAFNPPIHSIDEMNYMLGKIIKFVKGR